MRSADDDVEALSVELFVEFRLLPEVARPGHVYREDGVTLLFLDPRDTRLEIIRWCTDHLTLVEQNIARAAWGQPPVGLPLDDVMVADEPAWTRLPASVCLPDSEQVRWGALTPVREVREQARRIRQRAG